MAAPRTGGSTGNGAAKDSGSSSSGNFLSPRGGGGNAFGRREGTPAQGIAELANAAREQMQQLFGR